ncbi:MAG: hypothetical protein E7656_07865 [Ruminococcaceae bacterium]|nr:hypothetical protein [Oscillospiraceae bacterium]
MIGKIVDFIIGRASFVITAKNSHDVAVLNILRESGFYGCRVSQGKITFSCDCEKARGISKKLDALGVPYDLDMVGIVYYAKRLLSRVGVLAGVIVAVLLNGFFSDIIWHIDVRGNKNISDDDILRRLYGFGVYEGCRKSDIDIKSLTRDYMLSDDRVSFMHMNVNGTNAVVEVAEGVKKGKTENDKKAPCNIIAKCDGIVTRIDVYSGGREVENGQSVVKGQLLISSFFETRTVGHLLRRAKGTVFANTEPVFEMRIPKYKYEACSTWQEKKRSVSFLDYSLPIDGGTLVMREEKTQLETHRKPVFLIGNLLLPLTLEEENYTLQEYEQKERTLSEAQKIFDNEYKSWKSEFLKNGQILSDEIEEYEQDGFYVFVCRLSCIENIGIDKPFEIREN